MLGILVGRLERDRDRLSLFRWHENRFHLGSDLIRLLILDIISNTSIKKVHLFI